MSINFKIDSRDRVWMLWTNSIRLASERLPGHELYNHVDSPVNIDDIVRFEDYKPMSCFRVLITKG